MRALNAANTYPWKCWRDTRSSFLFVLSAIAANSALGLFVAYDPFGWIAAKAEWPRTLWTTTAQALMLTMVGLTPVAGFVLGALGVGTEFEQRTADFLLTRPRSRRSLLWMSWAVGAAEMVSLVILSILLVRIAGHQGAAVKAVRGMVGMCIVALVIYSVTYLTTTLTRSSRHGLSLGMLIFMAYTGLGVWLQLWYEIAIPNMWDMVFSSGRREVMSAGFAGELPVPAWFGWLAVCLAFTFFAQYVFERQEA
jgi:ABC-type transport system involved in multi-copper enzyme maturation permease subunit